MAHCWKIKGWDGNAILFERDIPGHLTEFEVVALLQRLAARDLSANEVICGSLRRNDREYAPFFERVGTGMPLSYGENPHYTAKRA